MELAKKLDESKMDLDDDVIMAVEDEDKLKLYEFYKISETKNIEYNSIGHWSARDGLKITTIPKWYRRKNLKVKILIGVQSNMELWRMERSGEIVILPKNIEIDCRGIKIVDAKNVDGKNV